MRVQAPAQVAILKYYLKRGLRPLVKSVIAEDNTRGLWVLGARVRIPDLRRPLPSMAEED